MLGALFLFPSRQHILYRLWQKRRGLRPPAPEGARLRPTPARPLVVARPAAVVEDRIAPPSALYQGRARLDFIMPPPDPNLATSWIGGLPKLPDHAIWPRSKDSPFLFVAQIAIADLPATIWGGLGPRTGSLAIFTDPDINFAKVSVLHVDGVLAERRYPAALQVAQSYPHLRQAIGGGLLAIPPETNALPLVKWPVRATPVDAGDDLPSPYFKYRDPANPASVQRKSLSLSDAAFVPYSWDTLLSLLTTLIIELNGSVRTEKRAGRLDAPYPDSHADRSAAANTLMALRDDLRKQASAQPFSAKVWDNLVAQMSTILVRGIARTPNPETGALEVVLQPPAPVLHRLPMEKHYSAFEYLSRVLYAADPNRLPPATRAALEPIWQHDAAHEVASMGGPIDLAAYVTAARDDLVCLIEVPCSELVGTTWHDISSFGVFIDPESLADWRLDRAVGEVSES